MRLSDVIRVVMGVKVPKIPKKNKYGRELQFRFYNLYTYDSSLILLVPITVFEFFKLLADDARKSWAHNSICFGSF